MFERTSADALPVTRDQLATTEVDFLGLAERERLIADARAALTILLLKPRGLRKTSSRGPSKLRLKLIACLMMLRVRQRALRSEPRQRSRLQRTSRRVAGLSLP
jgi:hypothetical protein